MRTKLIVTTLAKEEKSAGGRNTQVHKEIYFDLASSKCYHHQGFVKEFSYDADEKLNSSCWLNKFMVL